MPRPASSSSARMSKPWRCKSDIAEAGRTCLSASSRDFTGEAAWIADAGQSLGALSEEELHAMLGAVREQKMVSGCL